MSDMVHKRTVEIEREDFNEMAALHAGRADFDEVVAFWSRKHDSLLGPLPNYPIEYDRDDFSKAEVRWTCRDGDHTVVLPTSEVVDVCRAIEPPHDDESLESFTFVRPEKGDNYFRLIYERDPMPVKADGLSPQAKTRCVQAGTFVTAVVGGTCLVLYAGAIELGILLAAVGGLSCAAFDDGTLAE